MKKQNELVVRADEKRAHRHHAQREPDVIAEGRMQLPLREVLLPLSPVDAKHQGVEVADGFKHDSTHHLDNRWSHKLWKFRQFIV
jgi:hypothetical protein